VEVRCLLTPLAGLVAFDPIDVANELLQDLGPLRGQRFRFGCRNVDTDSKTLWAMPCRDVTAQPHIALKDGRLVDLPTFR
jgi:hypothetical protein